MNKWNLLPNQALARKVKDHKNDPKWYETYTTLGHFMWSLTILADVCFSNKIDFLMPTSFYFYFMQKYEIIENLYRWKVNLSLWAASWKQNKKLNIVFFWIKLPSFLTLLITVTAIQNLLGKLQVCSAFSKLYVFEVIK